MKKIYFSICLILISAMGFGQGATLQKQASNTSLFSGSGHDFIADVAYPNCNYAMANFAFVSDTSFPVDWYCWDFGDGSRRCYSYKNSALHTYSVPGIFSVSLTLIHREDTTVITKPNLVIIRNAPIVDFNYPASDTKLFAPVTLSFNNQTQKGDGDTLKYTWDFGDSDLSHDENPAHTFLNPGYYDVMLNVTDNYGCKVSNRVPVTIKDSAQIGEIEYLTSTCGKESTAFCSYTKQYVMLNDTVRIFGLIYANCCGTKTIAIGVTTDTIQIQQFSGGPLCTCSCGFCFDIKIPNISQDSIYVDFDGQIVLVTSDMQSIAETNTGKEFMIYPNPATGNLMVEVSQKADLEILNLEGQPLLTINNVNLKTSINIENLSRGVYIIKAKTGKGIKVKKFIKQ